MVPVFIIILVVLIIMVFVTVNLSKVAISKTDTSNSVDAGGLACGSVMANVFNATAVANSYLEAAYQEFYATYTVSVLATLFDVLKANKAGNMATSLAADALDQSSTAKMMAEMAISLCKPESSCSAEAPLAEAGMCAGTAAGFAMGASMAAEYAVSAMKSAISKTQRIIAAVTAFHIAQYYTYRNMRKTAMKGREDAIELGHKFCYMNSGIGVKLRAGSPPALGAAEMHGDVNNYRNTFSDFIDALGHAEKYSYAWIDGESRNHYVETVVHTDDVDTFDLKVTALPFPGVLGLLAGSLASESTAKGEFTTAQTQYKAGFDAYSDAAKTFGLAKIGLVAICAMDQACCPKRLCCGLIPGMCEVFAWGVNVGIGYLGTGDTAVGSGNTAVGAAAAATKPVYLMMTGALVGMLPGGVISSGGMDLAFSICWVDDIDHNRLVRVDTTHRHGGTDVGLWKSEYPEMKSFALIDFTGNGEIYPPDPRFDPSIVDTDSPKTTYDSCPKIIERVEKLRSKSTEMRQNADKNDTQATELENQALALEAESRVKEAQLLRDSAKKLRDEAANNRLDADSKDAEANKLVADNPACEYGLQA
jgi:hypothetical protein